MQSTEVNPIGKIKIEDDCLYSPTEKKTIKPTKATLAMYARNNSESAEISETLMGDFGRILEHVPVTDHSYFEALLYQISRDRTKYKSEQLMQQLAYYMVKWPQRFYDIVRPFWGTHSYESYVKNIFHGTNFIDYEVITAVISKMWNLAIIIVFPDGVTPFYHQNENPDIVLICNNMEWPEKYFCTTKPDNPNWRPIKGADWSSKIRIFTNVKNAHDSATKALRTRLVNKVVTDFNEVTSAIEDMKLKLADYQSDFEKIIEKINKCSYNMNELEAKQIVLCSKMIALGVDSSTLTKIGKAIEGIHYTCTTAQTKAPSQLAAPSQPAAPLQPTPSTTVSTTSSVVPPQTVSTTEVDTSSTTIMADVHVSATPSTSTIPAVSTTSALAVPAVSATPSTLGFSLPIPSTPANMPSTPAGALSVGAHQAMSSGSGVVWGPQQILNIGGHNVLIAGSRQSTVGGLSIRYGKILRGVHDFFCKCGRPFTTKADLTRHEKDNCPLLDSSAKQRHKCEAPGCDKTFSSKQYMPEHLHEYHLNVYLYYCKPCGKGFFKHCKLNHHKNCIPHLSGMGATSTFTPGNVTPQTQVTPQMQLSTTLQQGQIPVSTASTTSAMTTSDVQVLTSTQPNNPEQKQFEFSPPQKVDWNNPPGNGQDDDNDDEDNFPEVFL